MTNLSALVNTGQLAINVRSDEPVDKTVVVLGVARGGTTMVASVLRALGVYMGENLDPVLEDVELSAAVEQDNERAVERIVEERNRRFSVWGWKRPGAVEHWSMWKPRLRNPHVIAVYRDPFAIANRNRISMLQDCLEGIENATARLARLTAFVRGNELPTLLCSYEKSMLQPYEFVEGVDRFLGLQADERWNLAVANMRTSERYLRSSRVIDARGHVDIVNREYCAGWAFYTHRSDIAATVAVYVNGHLAGQARADVPRPDVQKAGFHASGLCGFWFCWPKGIWPSAGDHVEVWAEGDVSPLPGNSAVTME